MTRVKADGIAVGVEIGAKIALSWRGEVAGEPVGRDTVFYGASLTKQFIGFLPAGAVEAGLISVDDGVRHWLPELPEWVAQVRVRHLVHTERPSVASVSSWRRSWPPMTGLVADNEPARSAEMEHFLP